jgi:formylmethanofuran dehydrogenase subunit D
MEVDVMLKLSISDKYGNIKKGRNDYEEESHNLESAGDTMCYIASQDFIFEEGDEINIFVAQKNQYLMVKLDESLDSTIVFIPSHSWTYRINMEQTAKEAMPDHRFKSKRHYLGVRYATNEEIRRYQNWALNPHDQKEFSGAYPHASANVETRNDATFFACNAINGIYANNSHGSYPYQSWGINRQSDATLTIDFGRLVEVDKIGITIRADFPHDSYWTEVTLLFSDASSETFSLQKNTSPQFFYFKKRAVTYVQLTNLVKAEDESPFPALTEFEVYGINKL